jgi:hypothetical protein
MLVNPLTFTVILTGFPGQAVTPAMVDTGAFWAVRAIEKQAVKRKRKLFFIGFIGLYFGYCVMVLQIKPLQICPIDSWISSMFQSKYV